ncbi:MAG: urease accessory protein UreD [Pseudomonadota bacterium]
MSADRRAGRRYDAAEETRFAKTPGSDTPERARPTAAAPIGHTIAAQPRAVGHARIALMDGRLADLYQKGSARIMLPRGPGPGLEAVLVNTAGGITGDDRFCYEAEAVGGRLVLATQTAERLYRAQPGQIGRLNTTLRIGAGARLDWLPQESIVFEAAALDRRLSVDMAQDATLTATEAVILGRQAMGETVQHAHLTDRWEIRRNGRLVFADALRISGDIGAATCGPATLGGARAFATLLHVGPDAAALCAALRDAIGALGGASLRDGCLVARMVAADGLALRRCLAQALGILLGRDLPKVWQG